MEKPSQEKIEIARKYLECLHMFKTRPQKPLTEDYLMRHAELYYNLTQKLGDGDPIKAATRHANMMLDLHKTMELSTSDSSNSTH